MITTIIFIFILSLLIIVHEFGHFIMAKKVGVRVEKFSLGFGPEVLKTKKGDTEYSVAAIPLGGFVKLAGDNLEEYKGKSDEYFSKSIAQRFQIIFFGPLLNYVLGFLFFWVIFFAGYPTLTTKIGGLLDGFGAKEAGLQVGDRITMVDGKKVDYWEDLQKIIQDKKAENKVRLYIVRGSKEQTIDVSIRQKELPDLLGQRHNVGILGITPFDELVIVRHGFFDSFFLGIHKTWELTAMTYKGL
jgi:regulator of sigma E protease